jgi:catechol 2,3-dioxygenase-like lactoylglutathione lyase family enzyme
MEFLQVKETCLYVGNLVKSREFYEGKLGLPCIGIEEGRHIFFRAGSSVLLCFISEASSSRADKGLPPHGATGHIHLALEVEPSSFSLVKRELQNKGIIIEYEQQWKNGFESVYFRDPDQHLLEIVPKGLWG